ncbi:hypothetical protein ACFXGG_33485 [Streptomyces nigra]|uniref:hypothetical protein n=1 Tax=Streptomyces nigra TaxID=1827580 RepID=UPI0036C00514
MEGWNFWWGVAAFFLGGLATQLNGWLVYRRQRKDRADDAADALRQRREEFELQHLVEVNDLLRGCMHHLSASLVLSRIEAHRPADTPDDGLNEQSLEEQRAYQEGMGALQAQIGFIFDDAVRNKVGETVTRMDWAYHNRRREEPHRNLLFTGEMVNSAYEALSTRVRELYAGRART